MPEGDEEKLYLASRLTPTLVAFAVLFAISVPLFAYLEDWTAIESFYFGKLRGCELDNFSSCHAPPVGATNCALLTTALNAH